MSNLDDIENIKGISMIVSRVCRLLFSLKHTMH